MKATSAIKLFFFRKLVKLLVRPFVWANTRKKQNVITRAIRALWRKL